MNDDKKPISAAEIKETGRKAIADVVAKWRSEGLSDAIIEKRLGQALPRELRKK